jgi:uncharacterized membrane protein
MKATEELPTARALLVSDSARTPPRTALLLRIGAIAGALAVASAAAQLLTRSSLWTTGILGLVDLDSLCVILWIAALYSLQRDRIGNVGRVGAYASIAGIGLLVIVNLGMGIAAREEGNELAGMSDAVGILLVTAILAAVWGVLALGTASLDAAVLPGGAVALWTVGLMASMVRSSIVGASLGGVGVLWSSVILWRGRAGARGLSGANPERAPVSAAIRLPALDALRGTIMILMAIDHASLFVRRWHPFEIWNQPLPDYPNLAALLTRLATHPCAPGFFFLMGAGMVLFVDSRRHQGWDWRRIAGVLALRGLLLIVLEQVIVDLATSGQINPFDLSILAGLGGAMILAMLFIRLGGAVVAGVGGAILLVMQVVPLALDRWDLGPFSFVRLLLVPGSVGPFSVLYPVIPWLGVVLLGMAFGRLLLADQRRAYRIALIAGLASLALFPVVRLSDGLGNLQPLAGRTVIDVFNLVKYPPSLSFLLLTLGFDLVLLSLFAGAGKHLERFGRPLITFGKTALYFFLAHWFIYGMLGMYFLEPGTLPSTYLVWAIGLLLMIPVCRVYGRMRQASPAGSIWRMI